MPDAHEAEFEYRRIQVHDQQAERQRKNVLQKTLVFSKRAWQIMLEVRFRLAKHIHFRIKYVEKSCQAQIYRLKRLNFKATTIPAVPAQDPDRYPNPGRDAEAFRRAFMEAIGEFNSYGSAGHSTRWQIDEQSACQMFGLKATDETKMYSIPGC